MLITAWFDRLDRSRRLGVLAMGMAGLLYTALIMRRGAVSGESVAAGVGWLLIVIRFACDGAGTEDGKSLKLGGFLILVFALVQAAHLDSLDLWFPRAFPFLLFAGVLLATEGAVSFHRHWRSAVILGIVALSARLEALLDWGGLLTLSHAKTAGLLLYVMGYDVTSQGPVIALPGGAVRVLEACTGMALIFLLLKLSAIAFVALRLRWEALLSMLVAAFVVGFSVGVVRIATLATVVQNHERFVWFHGPPGENLFSTLGILLFAPFLISAEKPLAALLTKASRAWECAVPGATSVLKISCAVLSGFAMAFWLKPELGDRQSDLPISPVPWAMPGIPPQKEELVEIPGELKTARFDSIKQARRCRFSMNGEAWTVFVCSVSGGLGGPRDFIRSPVITRFLGGQFPELTLSANDLEPDPWSQAEEIEGAAAGIARHSKGLFAIRGINAAGQPFFTSGQYSASQRGVLTGWRSWEQWLTTGLPLKDLRYWLVVIAREP